MGNPATGPTSNSFKVAAAGFITGLGTILDGLIQNPTTHVAAAQAAVTDGKLAVGGIVTLLSVLGKLYHDKGYNDASLAAGGKTAIDDVPEIKVDVAKALAATEVDVPALKTVVTDIGSRLKAVENKAGVEIQKVLPTIEEVTPILREALAGILGGSSVPTSSAPPAGSGGADMQGSPGGPGAVDGAATPPPVAG